MSPRDLFGKPEEIFHIGIKALIRNSTGDFLVLETDLGETSMWDLPGGRIHKDQDIEITLERELEEELGVTIFENKGMFDINIANVRIPFDQYNVRLMLITYICVIPDTQVIVISDEHRQFKWVSCEEAARLLSEKFPKAFITKLRDIPY